MLHIYFGKMQDAIYNTEVYFKNTYQEDWITDDFAREVIKGVDRSEVRRHLGDVFAVHYDFSGISRSESCKNPQKGSLAAS